MTIDRAEWHADEAALRALVEGGIGPVAASSLETHVMRCDRCRTALNALAFTEQVDRAWTTVLDSVLAPAPGIVERLLHRIGISEETGRLLAAVPALRGGWLLGAFAVLIFAGVASLFSEDAGTTMFLLVAPLAPVAGVAAAFGGDADPSHEIVVATPYPALRLLLLRTVAVLVTCAPVAMLVGLALPGPGWLTVAWLSPAFAAIAVTLALSAAVGLTSAAVGVGLVWSTSCVVAGHLHEPLAMVGPTSQLVFVVLVAGGAAVIATRLQVIDLPRRLS